MITSCITHPLGSLAISKASHRSAWAFVWANQFLNNHNDIFDISDTINGYNKIAFYHGMEFNGILNIFGGADDLLINKLESIIESDSDMISLDHEMPKYGVLLKKRVGVKSSSTRLTNQFCDKVDKKFNNIEVIQQKDFKLPHLYLGDSHCFSVYTPKGMVSRLDGQTLFGMLKKGIKSFIEQFEGIESLTLYAGNIDIRHHLARYDWNTTLPDMMEELEKQLLDLPFRDIELVYALPIEDESRRLPKTGQYKETPFFGSRDIRVKILNMFNNHIDEIAERNKFKVFRWPSHWYDDNNGLEFFKYMEKPQSVHLSRQYYRWDLDKNEENTMLNPNKMNDILIF